MASAAAAVSGLRQQLSRTSSHPLHLSSSSLRHHQKQRRRPSSPPSALSFPTLTTHFPPPLPRPPSLSVAGSRRLLSTPASASSPVARFPPAPRRVSLEDEDDDGEEDDESEGEGVFDVASYDDEDSGEEEEEEDMENDEEGEDAEFHGQMDDLESESPAPPQGQQLPRYPSPNLSVKEKKELAAYAHGLGKRLKCQQVGKSGVTASVVAAFVETLEANELLKLKVHGSCPGELPEVIKQLEESTGSVAVGRIGRSVILYRPSFSKMQKKDTQAVKKTWRPRSKEPTYGLRLQKKRPAQRSSSHRSSNSATRI